MKKTLTIFFFLFGLIATAKAQVSAGVDIFSSDTFVTIGTNPDNDLFGEGRISTGGDIGIELMGGYNLIKKQDVNFYLGLGLGVNDDRRGNDFYIGVPFGLLVKPFGSAPNLGLVLEAAPIIPDETDSYFRAGFGFKYTFR